MTQLDTALETVRQVHHRVMNEYKDSVIARLDEIGWSSDPFQELHKYVVELRKERESE